VKSSYSKHYPSHDHESAKLGKERRESQNEQKCAFPFSSDLPAGVVVSKLLSGLGNCDEVSDLQWKPQLHPKYLKQLYTQMVLKVDEDHKEEAVHFFKLVNAT
jgi:hypothetical protein